MRQKKTTAATGSNRVREEMQVVNNDLRSAYIVNEVAQSIMDAYVKPLVTKKKLYLHLLDALKGFDGKLQVELAFNLFYYLRGQCAQYTGMFHVDGVLDYLYTHLEAYIDEELHNGRFSLTNQRSKSTAPDA